MSRQTFHVDIAILGGRLANPPQEESDSMGERHTRLVSLHACRTCARAPVSSLLCGACPSKAPSKHGPAERGTKTLLDGVGGRVKWRRSSGSDGYVKHRQGQERVGKVGGMGSGGVWPVLSWRKGGEVALDHNLCIAMVGAPTWAHRHMRACASLRRDRPTWWSAWPRSRSRAAGTSGRPWACRPRRRRTR